MRNIQRGKAFYFRLKIGYALTTGIFIKYVFYTRIYVYMLRWYVIQLLKNFISNYISERHRNYEGICVIYIDLFKWVWFFWKEKIITFSEFLGVSCFIDSLDFDASSKFFFIFINYI